MNIDLELYKIVKKYNINKFYPQIEYIYTREIVDELLNELFDNIHPKMKIAVRGGGRHTSELLASLNEENRKKISYIIDQNFINEKEGIKVIHPLEIEDSDIDIVIISSYQYRLDMKIELLDEYRIKKVIDLYDYFNMHNLILDKEYYEIKADNCTPHITYTDLCCARNQFKNAETDEEKQYFLQKIIFLYVEIRDFINAKKYIMEYLEYNMDLKENYRNFLEEIEELLKSIEAILAKRENDIIINWVDNVTYDEMIEQTFVQKLAKESLVLSNAYNVSPWTHFSLITLLTGKMPIKDKTFRVSKLDGNNSEIIKLLENHDYKFMYIGNPGMYCDTFDRENVPEHPPSYYRILFKGRSVSECSTRLQWISLRERMKQENPVCHLIHNLAETHYPYYYASMESPLGDRNNYRLKGISYIMQELEWYSSFISRQADYIILSDHGEMTNNVHAYSKYRSNIPVIIRSHKILPGEEKRFFSHRDFKSLFQYLFDNKNETFNSAFSNVIYGENLDYYNKELLLMHIIEWINGERKLDMSHFQSRHVRTETDIFVKYANGKEAYYILPDENNNLIQDEGSQNRIEELRKLCGDEFIDISKEPMFKDSHLMYDYLDKIDSSDIRW